MLWTLTYSNSGFLRVAHVFLHGGLKIFHTAFKAICLLRLKIGSSHAVGASSVASGLLCLLSLN